ncbi:hypothetical protein SBA5_490054 [Candidatus Sulfotelmatomonas gaucii]|uniref:Uncharacterized protein n=1 Tax=Candidatus Sulfuritelmatomonas gaucii TaxID=2043161 RepID=A0A2N9LPX9_9BACT|nr:hypothetical protein SBA5_490054 [Candidatus Sulfotelmatomonas gaucii]
MSTPRSTTERTNRKAISEALLAEKLGLNDSWIERWEENGAWREESCAPDQLPEFIRQKLNRGELKEVEEKVDQLVAAGCQRSVVYFCLQQLSPAAEWSRSGGHLEGVQAQQGEELASQKQKRAIATREDMATVASNARAARKEIHRHKYELSFTAEALRCALPVGFSTSAENPEDALLLLESALSWVAKLADAYATPMVSTLIKSKGLLYLAMYVGRHADERKLCGQRTDSVLADSKKASGDRRARRTHLPAANVLVNLLSMIMGADQSWSPSELKEKVKSFRQDYPRLYRLLEMKLAELHKFASR